MRSTHKTPLLVVAVALMLGWLLAACSETNEPELPDPDDTSYVKYFVCPDINSSDGLTPRLTAVSDGYIMTELFDASAPSVMVFHMMKRATKESVLLTASSDAVWIIDLQSNETRTEVPACAYLPYNGGYVYSCGSMTTATNTYVEEYCLTTDGSDASRRNKSRAGRGNDGLDFARELIIKDILNPLAEELGEAEGQMKHVPQSTSAKMALEVWTRLGIPMAKAQLWANNPAKIGELTSEVITAEQKRFKLTKTIVESIEKAKNIYNAALNAFMLGGDFMEDADNTSGAGIVTAESFDVSARAMQFNNSRIYYGAENHKTTLRLTGIEQNSATVVGSYSSADGGFTTMGYKLYEKGKEIFSDNATLDGRIEYRFSNLQYGHTYIARAFANVMGTTYLSYAVVIELEKALLVSEDSVSFTNTGGKRTVSVTAPGPDWNLTVKNAPEWCDVTCTRSYGSVWEVALTAGTTDSERSATITVFADKQGEETMQHDIVVTQQRLPSRLVFKGSGIRSYETAPVSQTLTLNYYKGGYEIWYTSILANGFYRFPRSWNTSMSAPEDDANHAYNSFRCDVTETAINVEVSVDLSFTNSAGTFIDKTGELAIKVNLETMTAEVSERVHSYAVYPNGPYEYTDTYTATLGYEGN